MKGLLIFLTFSLCMCHIEAQGDEEIIWDSISFEEPYEFLTIDSNQENIWMIGTPDEFWESEAYIGTNAIFTGEEYYPVNNHSSFTLILNEKNIPYYPYSVYLEFMHTMDSEQGKDGGYIDVSYDGGTTWENIINDYTSCINPADYSAEYLYSENDTLFNGNPGFSGLIEEWTTVRFGWEVCLVKNQSIDGDSTLLRFNFISDDNETSQKGWMIDHIRLFSVPLSGSSQNYNSQLFAIYPNPAEDYIHLLNSSNIEVKKVSLFTVNGELIWTKNADSEYLLGSLPSGVYMLRIEYDNSVSVKKLIRK